MLEKLKELVLRYEDLQAQLADPSVYGDAERLRRVNQELKELTPVAEACRAYEQAAADEAAAEEMLCDPELRDLAQAELAAAKAEAERPAAGPPAPPAAQGPERPPGRHPGGAQRRRRRGRGPVCRLPPADVRHVRPAPGLAG